MTHPPVLPDLLRLSGFWVTTVGSESDVAVATSQCYTAGTLVTRGNVPGSHWLISSKAVTIRHQEEIAEHSRRKVTKDASQSNMAHGSGLRKWFTICHRGHRGDRWVTMDLQVWTPSFRCTLVMCVGGEVLDMHTEVHRGKGEREKGEREQEGGGGGGERGTYGEAVPVEFH